MVLCYLEMTEESDKMFIEVDYDEWDISDDDDVELWNYSEKEVVRPI